jgi:hypothetical protein
MATYKNLRYCKVVHSSTTYDVMLAVTDLDEVNDILQEWALTSNGPGELLNLPEELVENIDAKEINLISKNINSFVYVKGALLGYVDAARNAGISGTFPVLPKTLVAAKYVMPATSAYLWSTATFSGLFANYTIPTASFTLVENEVNYIGIDYSLGTPVYKLYANQSSFNYSSIIPVCAVLYFNSELNVIPYGQAGYGAPEKLQINQDNRKEFNIITDFTLAASTRYVELSALTVNKGTGNVVCLIMDTETANHAGKYVINYLFRVIDDTNLLIFNVLSGSFDTLAEAKESDMITDLPDPIKEGCVLVGRMIVLKDSATPTVQKIQRVNPFATVV